jgi:hypothetical protein
MVAMKHFLFLQETQHSQERCRVMVLATDARLSTLTSKLTDAVPVLVLIVIVAGSLGRPPAPVRE